MSRPRIEIEKDASDWVIEIVGFLFLAGLILIPLIYFYDLPDRIPSHYNASGEVDGFSSRNSLWMLPAIGLIMFVGMYVLTKYPHIYNYPTEITEENAERQYRGAIKLVRVLNTLTVGAFLYLSTNSILGAISEDYGLGFWFIPVLMFAMFAPIGFYGYYAFKKK